MDAYVLTLVFVSGSHQTTNSSHHDFLSKETCEYHKSVIVKINEERRLRFNGSGLGLAIAFCSKK